jgi:hypothetical protein
MLCHAWCTPTAGPSDLPQFSSLWNVTWCCILHVYNIFTPCDPHTPHILKQAWDRAKTAEEKAKEAERREAEEKARLVSERSRQWDLGCSNLGAGAATSTQSLTAGLPVSELLLLCCFDVPLLTWQVG